MLNFHQICLDICLISGPLYFTYSFLGIIFLVKELFNFDYPKREDWSLIGKPEIRQICLKLLANFQAWLKIDAWPELLFKVQIVPISNQNCLHFSRTGRDNKHSLSKASSKMDFHRCRHFEQVDGWKKIKSQKCRKNEI